MMVRAHENDAAVTHFAECGPVAGEIIPMLPRADGVARPLEDTIGAIRKEPAKLRRKGRPTYMRRPRFLARRRCGNLGLRLVIDGAEIIARA